MANINDNFLDMYKELESRIKMYWCISIRL